MKLDIDNPAIYIPLTVLGVAGLGAIVYGLTRSGSKSVFTIIFENKNLDQVIGSGDAPYFDQLASDYYLAQNYFVSQHPSLPSYITLTSGKDNGIIDDGPPSQHTVAGTENIFSQMNAAGIPWRSYQESMPTPCAASSSGLYMVRHNPPMYYDDVNQGDACMQRVVPLDSALQTDLDSNGYRYLWITPNAYNDMHDAPPNALPGQAGKASVQTGDHWLSQILPKIMASPGYRNGGTIFILFDEGADGRHRIPVLVINEQIKGKAASMPQPAFGHPSYLAAVQDLLGLPRLATTQGIVPLPVS